jgi:streptogramin lyase
MVLAGVLAFLASACGEAQQSITREVRTAAAVRALPGAFYPESMSAQRDGTLYVGSLATGEVVKVSPAGDVAHFTSGGAHTAGVLVDEPGGALWLCSVDLAGGPQSLRRYDLAHGALLASIPLARGVFCNDMVFGNAGNLYVTDSSGSILRLAPGGQSVDVWLHDARFVPAPGGFGPDGIVWAGGSLYMNHFASGALYRIAVKADGSAGEVVPLTVSPPLVHPDGMRALGPNTLALVDAVAFTPGGRGRVLALTLDGDRAKARTLDDTLADPTSLVVAAGRLWVTEGQLPILLGGTPGVQPTLPFVVKAVALP